MVSIPEHRFIGHKKAIKIPKILILLGSAYSVKFTASVRWTDANRILLGTLSQGRTASCFLALWQNKRCARQTSRSSPRNPRLISRCTHGGEKAAVNTTRRREASCPNAVLACRIAIRDRHSKNLVVTDKRVNTRSGIVRLYAGKELGVQGVQLV
jgi:hypothetical protein